MKPAPHPTLPQIPVSAFDVQRALALDVAGHLAAVACAVLVMALWMAWALGPGLGSGVQWSAVAMLVYGLGASKVWRGLKHHPFERFGAANRITLCRLASVSLLVAWAAHGASSGGGLTPTAVPWQAWLLVSVVAVTALLDAFDGAMARRAGMSSDFGARFDMETDAAFILVLCVLVWQSGVTGPWILLAGLMRYAFVAAAQVWPWLGVRLPPSWRRQAVCVVQVVVLVLALAPVTPALLALVLNVCSLALLTLSFATDVFSLYRYRLTI